MMPTMSKIRLLRLLNRLSPPLCAFCSTPTGSSLCCDRCNGLLQRNRVACGRCASPLHAAPGSLCGRCQSRPPPYHLAAAPLLYEFPVDAAIKALKFRRHLYYLPVFGDLLLNEIAQQFTNVDGLVPVPLHRWRHALRGFNQATELCKRIRRNNGLPVVTGVTRCARDKNAKRPVRRGAPAKSSWRILGFRTIGIPAPAYHRRCHDNRRNLRAACQCVARGRR